MAYIDVTYVENRVRERLLIELTDDTETPTGAIVTAKITNAITTIEARLNNVLRKTYTLPLTETATPDTTAYEDSVELLKDLVLSLSTFMPM